MTNSLATTFVMTDGLAEKFSSEIVTHKGIVMKICRIYGASRDDADDLYQEIVLNAWLSYPKFEGRSKFSTWLYRVALNTALYQNRKNKFSGRFTGLEAVEHHASDDSDNEKTALLFHALAQLDEQEKSIVVLYLDELSYREMAEITGLTETNIGVKLNRIKTKIKNILSNYGTR